MFVSTAAAAAAPDAPAAACLYPYVDDEDWWKLNFHEK